MKDINKLKDQYKSIVDEILKDNPLDIDIDELIEVEEYLIKDKDKLGSIKKTYLMLLILCDDNIFRETFYFFPFSVLECFIPRQFLVDRIEELGLDKE